jgi:hypothetical protein
MEFLVKAVDASQEPPQSTQVERRIARILHSPIIAILFFLNL